MPAAPTPTPNSLDGNWLLVGQLPFIGPGQVSNTFGISMTFSTVGDQIVGGGSDQVPCGQSFVVGGGVVISGTTAKDGSFTAQTAATQPSGVSTLQIHGTLPSSNTSSWTGTYDFSNNDSTCPFNSSGPLTAVRITDLTGTYAGAGNLYPSGGSSSGNGQPVSITLTFQQGQTTPQIQSVDERVLAGTVQVQGTSCFSSGQIASQPEWQSSLLGTRLLATFTMNDGSKLSVSASIEDPLSSKLQVISMLVGGGSCDGQFIGTFDASRQ